MNNQQSIYYLLSVFCLLNFCSPSYANMGSSSIIPIQDNISFKTFSKKEQRTFKQLKKRENKPNKEARNDGLYESLFGLGLLLLGMLFLIASIAGSLLMFILGLITILFGLVLLIIGIVKAFKSTKQMEQKRLRLTFF